MIQTLVAACPVDEKDDKIQKATGLVSSTSEALRARVAMPRFVLKEPSFTEPRAPVEPPAPRSRLESDELRTQLGVIGAIGGALGIAGLVVLGSGGPAILGFFCLIAAAAVFVGIFQFVGTERTKHAEVLRRAAEEHEKLVQAHSSAVQAARRRFEEELGQWRAKAERVRQARIRWEQAMYYCHRHDVVFLADGYDEVARPEDMPTLLDIGDIPLEHGVS